MADRRRAYRRGRLAEWLACQFLRLKGYRIAARNLRTPVGEIDIIARRGTLIVFVEVKARASEQAALDAITYNAQRRIEAAGEYWLSRQRDASSLNWRFDVVAVLPRALPRHFENVW